MHEQILRFASPNSLAKTTTVHYCRTTTEGLSALSDNGVRGLLGLFGKAEAPRTSYNLDEEKASVIRAGEILFMDDMAFASLDMIVNTVKMEKLLPKLNQLLSRDSIRVMIHEQYFYSDYPAYQSDFEAKLECVFGFLRENSYRSVFFEELL